jgi:hypothetical protein
MQFLHHLSLLEGIRQRAGEGGGGRVCAAEGGGCRARRKEPVVGRWLTRGRDIFVGRSPPPPPGEEVVIGGC